MNCDFTYVLDGHSVVPCPDPLVWAEWHHTHKEDRTLMFTHLATFMPITVSTVFWGMDSLAAWKKDRPPRCFESLIFGGHMDGVGRKYHTWDEAIEGHDKLVEEARKSSF